MATEVAPDAPTAARSAAADLIASINMELDVSASVVIGGTLLTSGVGNVIGTLFGVLINGAIVSILQFNGALSSWWTPIGVGALTLIFIGI